MSDSLLLTTDERSVEEVLRVLQQHKQDGKFWRLLETSSFLTERNLGLLIPYLKVGQHFGCLLYNGHRIPYSDLLVLIQNSGKWRMSPAEYLQAKLARNPDPRCLWLFNYVLDPSTDQFDFSKLAKLTQLLPSLSQDPTSYLSILVQDIVRYLLMPYLTH